jgi:S1-C subfamily serine protease
MVKTFRSVLALGAVAPLFAACNNPIGSAGASPSPPATSYTAVVDEASPSIVLIETQGGLGSGVVFDRSGDVVTNDHVIAGAQQMRVTTWSGKQYPATLVAGYAASDIAVIKASTTTLPPAHWADSSKLQVGEVVLAMGNPLGFQSSVTEGIVSALGRTVMAPDGFVLTNLVQTSAAINPGNSGGGLVDLQGRVVGVPTLGAVNPAMGSSAPGIGFALPSNTVIDYANQLIKNGRVVNTHTAYLGVQVGDVSPPGVIVLDIVSGSPAESAGIQTGDIIRAVNGHPIGNSADLASALSRLSPGSMATLTVSRDGHTQSIQVTLGTQPAQ